MADNVNQNNQTQNDQPEETQVTQPAEKTPTAREAESAPDNQQPQELVEPTQTQESAPTEPVDSEPQTEPEDQTAPEKQAIPEEQTAEPNPEPQEPVKSVKPKNSKVSSPLSGGVQAPTDLRTDNKPHWYVVHTYSGHESKVAATLKQRIESQKLQDRILDILVPTQEKIEIKEGKKSKVNEKIFPGYLLIRMILDDNSWLAVRTTPGITSFVGMGNRPTPLADQEVDTIQKFMTMEAPKFKTTFTVGEAVKIVDGPFSEFLGSINEIDEEKGKLKVMVSIFGRETPVELDFLQVAKL